MSKEYCYTINGYMVVRSIGYQAFLGAPLKLYDHTGPVTDYHVIG